MTNNSRIEEIALKSMNNKEHRDNCYHNTPARIFYYPCKKDRNSPYKNTENRNETTKECDTSESKKVGENIASIEAQLAVK